MSIKTRESFHNIKTFDRVDNLAQKSRGGFSELNRSANETQETQYESGVDYAGERIQQSSEKTGRVSATGAKQIGQWGVRESRNLLRKYRARSRKTPEIRVNLPRKALNAPKTKPLMSGNPLLAAPKGSTRTKVKNTQKTKRAIKKIISGAVRFFRRAIQTTIKVVKAAISAIKSIIAIIAAGGWIVVVIILVICIIGAIVGSIYENPELLPSDAKVS